MNLLLRPWRALAAFVERLLSRRRARKLRALGLPTAAQAVTGLLPAAQSPAPLRLALRIPGPLEAETAREFWAAPSGAAIVRAPGKSPPRLLRLSALPAPPGALAVLRPEVFGLGSHRTPLPRTLARPLRGPWSAPEPVGLRALAIAGEGVPFPLALRPAALGIDAHGEPRAARLPPLPEPRRFAWASAPPARRVPPAPSLGSVRPECLGLDEEGRLPIERDVPKTTTERPPPPAPGRFLRPRTPLARAPLSRLDVRAYRIDPRALRFANEEILPPGPRAPPPLWLQPAFRARFVYLPWMAQPRLRGMAPLQAELFALWWEAEVRKKPGARDPESWDQPDDVVWMMQDDCKEQMLIRRDCKKDEQAPEEQELEMEELGPAIFARFSLDENDFVPKTEFIEFFEMPRPESELDRPVADAYLQWRTLMNGLEER